MKGFKRYLIIGTLLLIAYLMAMSNRPMATDWKPSLKNTDKIPFGTYVLYHRLGDIFTHAQIKTYREPVYNVINDEKISNATYIIISNYIELHKDDYQKLTQYVKKGNEVFLAAWTFEAALNDSLKLYTGDTTARTGDATRLRFTNKKYSDNRYAVDHYATNTYFTAFDTSRTTVLGQNEFGSPNFIRIRMGKGALYLCSNPLMFSNYSLLQDQGSAYAAIALSHLKNNSNIVWDEFYTQGRGGQQTPMRVFLNNGALRGATYIAFFSLLVFVLYETKRRQRIIPVIEPLSNTSVEFATVVGQVYYEQRDNANIAQKIAAYFLEHIRNQFYLKTNTFDEEFISALSQKSGVDAGLVQQIIAQINKVRGGHTISDGELIAFNQHIEQFYFQSR